MPRIATLTPREVTELSGAPRHVIEKAIEERVLAVRQRRSPSATHQARRALPAHAVAYAAVVANLDLRLSARQKKHLAARLSHIDPANIRTARVDLAPAVELDVGRLVGDAMERTERYCVARDAAIVSDATIMGGTPIIRGTRITVYSVLGRVAHGETVDDVLSDNPDLSREVVEAAITYARTHPLMGRPSGRPWSKVA